MSRFLSPLLWAALYMLAAIHAAHAARSAPDDEPHPANATAPGSNHSISGRRLSANPPFSLGDWCPLPTSVASYGCNLLGYAPEDIPEDITTPISMVGGLGGGPGHVSYCDLRGPALKHVVKIKIFSDQETHRSINYVDQITVTWSDRSITRIGGCDRSGCAVCDCEWAMTLDSDKHVIDLSGSNLVKSYQMAIDGFHAKNVGDAGRLFGYLTMNVTAASEATAKQQGYSSCCAGDGYTFTSEKSVGSGIICGITYRSGSKVDAFGVVFFKPVTKVYHHITSTPTELRSNCKPVLNITFARGACKTGPDYRFDYATINVGHSTLVATSYANTLAPEASLKLEASPKFNAFTQDVIGGTGSGEFSLYFTEIATDSLAWGATVTRGNPPYQTTYTMPQFVDQVCPAYSNACDSVPETLLARGDCCQWSSAQSRIHADAIKWNGVLKVTFKDVSGLEFYRDVPTSGTFQVESWASDFRSGHYCQALPSLLSSCNKLPTWNPDLDSCNGVPWKPTEFIVLA